MATKVIWILAGTVIVAFAAALLLPGMASS